MEITVKIEEINYGDVAVKAMPFMRKAAQKQNNTAGKTIMAISDLPDSLIYDLFDAIPIEQKMRSLLHLQWKIRQMSFQQSINCQKITKSA